jgi:hypothetical protein
MAISSNQKPLSLSTTSQVRIKYLYLAYQVKAVGIMTFKVVNAVYTPRNNEVTLYESNVVFLHSDAVKAELKVLKVITHLDGPLLEELDEPSNLLLAREEYNFLQVFRVDEYPNIIEGEVFYVAYVVLHDSIVYRKEVLVFSKKGDQIVVSRKVASFSAQNQF